ncbi:MAG: DUF1080 domain-containing protein [candidate division KSB1 bacterium]|nr:DUF1080 domain-containing protein [candidate division KSB1 bacterium]
MKTIVLFCLLAVAVVFAEPHQQFYEYEHPIHSAERENPPIVQSGTESTQEKAGKAPSDAVILFDGGDLSAWRTAEGEPADWKVTDEYFECVPGKSLIITKQAFGDCQLHVEWASPAEPEGNGQGRGNSGVFLMGKYEIQVLDSYENTTYADGQAAALYGQKPPEVNASRPPGKWQTYDIIFRRPRFNPDGSVRKPAVVTVFHNGVLVQDHVELTGPTTYQIRTDYAPHSDRLPIFLQDHSNPVRYRNVWIRDLEKENETKPSAGHVTVSEKDLNAYTGLYRSKSDPSFELNVKRAEDDKLWVDQVRRDQVVFRPQSWRGFYAPVCQMQMAFRHRDGKVTGLRLIQDGKEMFLEKVK